MDFSLYYCGVFTLQYKLYIWHYINYKYFTGSWGVGQNCTFWFAMISESVDYLNMMRRFGTALSTSVTVQMFPFKVLLKWVQGTCHLVQKKIAGWTSNKAAHYEEWVQCSWDHLWSRPVCVLRLGGFWKSLQNLKLFDPCDLSK